MDVSGLKKVHVVGPHAAHVIDRRDHARRARDPSRGARPTRACSTSAGRSSRTASSIAPAPRPGWSSTARAPGHEQLQRAGRGQATSPSLFDDDLHDLSLQGPLAVDFLQRYVPGIRDLPYFHHMQTRLFDAPVMLSRTGYTGERGYEIFCRGQDALMIWDTILAEGADMGIIPCRFTVLDMLRVESYLLFYPYDNSQMYPFEDEAPGDTLWELGLAVHGHARASRVPRRGGARPAQGPGAVQDLRRPRGGQTPPRPKATSCGRTAARSGVITCGMYSTLTTQVDGHRPDGRGPRRAGQPARGPRCRVNGPAIAHALPFDDPEEDEAQRGRLTERGDRRG